MQLGFPDTGSFDRDELIQLLARLTGLPEAKLIPGADIYHDLGIDSMAALRVVANVEAHYRLTFDEAEAADIRTVEQFLDMVEATIALES